MEIKYKELEESSPEIKDFDGFVGDDSDLDDIEIDDELIANVENDDEINSSKLEEEIWLEIDV